MTSGIYELTFPDGSNYIGKSINVEERWKQHLDKMQKGTAAKPMQAKWDRYGDFDAKLLVACHVDHIDILEETFIARCNPTLNTTRPKDRMEGVYEEEFDLVLGLMKFSTLEHVAGLASLTNKNDQLKREVGELQDEVDRLDLKRSEEELAADIEERILELSDTCDEYHDLINERDATIRDLRYELSDARRTVARLQQPWWKKIFG